MSLRPLLATGMWCLGLTIPAAPAWSQTFNPINPLPGSSPNSTQGFGIGATGEVALGQSGNSPIYWISGTTYALPTASGASGGIAYGINTSYQAVAGITTGVGAGSTATVWASPYNFSPIYLTSTSLYSTAYAISSDGTVVVGNAISSPNNGAAVIWTISYNSSGPTVTGNAITSFFGVNSATGVSGNGQVVVGVTNGLAFRWQSGSLTPLGDLPGGTVDSGAQAISRDGSTIVGYGTDATGRKAFRYTQSTGMVSLGALPGSTFSIANAVSANGKVIVGKSTSGSDYAAFIWDPINGMRNLKSVLISDYGLETQYQGWRLTEAFAISDDGFRISGTGYDLSGNNRGWVVDMTPVPEAPQSLSVAATMFGLLGMRRWIAARIMNSFRFW